ncbi:MAG: hypothetical protein TU36_003035 [Vulcanisaeta sp. AZ3]
MSHKIGISRISVKLNNDAVVAVVGLITTIALLAFIRAVRPINLSLHRDIAGIALFLISALFFLWLLITSIREKRPG